MRKVTKKWAQADGTKVRICDMTDTHLVNAIRYLRRVARAVSAAELEAAGHFLATTSADMASYFAAQEFDRLLANPDGDPPEVLEDLVEEADRRGLDHGDVPGKLARRMRDAARR